MTKQLEQNKTQIILNQKANDFLSLGLSKNKLNVSCHKGTDKSGSNSTFIYSRLLECINQSCRKYLIFSLAPNKLCKFTIPMSKFTFLLIFIIF